MKSQERLECDGIVFDPTRGCYWIESDADRWIPLNEPSIRRHLRADGISPKSEGRLVSPLELILNRIQLDQYVDYAGPLAGCSAGLHKVEESRILVTESPHLVDSKTGEWPVLGQLIDGLLNDGVIDQRPYLFGWLRVAVVALATSQKRPGQALVLAGPHACGKSLLQSLITILLGGRSARAYPFMIQRTNFNAELFGAEHLMIEDEAASTDIRTRRNFGAQLKIVTANAVQWCHAKNKQALSLTPFWRLTVSVNDEPENLLVLPPLDESLEDKIILLRANKRPMPMPTNTDHERVLFWETLKSELPAFVAHLEQWEIPAELKSSRYGITHYHHPELLGAIDELSPENKLLTLMDSVLFANTTTPWSGTAPSLERLLTASETYGREAQKLFPWPNACGTYLSRLGRKLPERMACKKIGNTNHWTIQPPLSVTA